MSILFGSHICIIMNHEPAVMEEPKGCCVVSGLCSQLRVGYNLGIKGQLDKRFAGMCSPEVTW